MRLLPALALGAAFVCWSIPSVATADTYVEDPPYPGIAAGWGPSPGYSFGEVLIVPYGNTVLDDFTFSVETLDTPFPFVAQVYAWDAGLGPAGPALYTSGMVNTTSTLTPYTFTPDLPLVAGAEYIAFLTNEPNGVSLGGTGDGAFQASLSGNSGPFELAEGDPTIDADWPMTGIGLLAAFRADLSPEPVPEPLTLSLFATGIVGAVAMRSRNKAKRQVIPKS